MEVDRKPFMRRVRGMRDVFVGALWCLIHRRFVHTRDGFPKVAPSVSLRPLWIEGGRLRIELAGGCRLYPNILIQGSGTFRLGRGSYVGDYCVIGVNGSVNIGENVMIAQSVSVRDSDHRMVRVDIPMAHQGIDVEPVVIEDDVWIGHGAVILKGVRIGKGSVVAGGAVVREDVAPLSIVGGVPARVIGSRVGGNKK